MNLGEAMEIAWGKLSVDQRERAKSILLHSYDPEFFAEVRRLVEVKGLTNWLPAGWHFGQGMAVRNVLRTEGFPDAELPLLPEVYGRDVGGWDDYYVQCIEYAAGMRE
jgi:hypothetical protein